MARLLQAQPLSEDQRGEERPAAHRPTQPASSVTIEDRWKAHRRSNYVFTTTDDTRLTMPGWDYVTKIVQAASETSRWHRHDLRRTGVTLWAAGTEPHIIEAAVNHVSIHSPLAATYNKARYRSQVAAAHRCWGTIWKG